MAATLLAEVHHPTATRLLLERVPKAKLADAWSAFVTEPLQPTLRPSRGGVDVGFDARTQSLASD